MSHFSVLCILPPGLSDDQIGKSLEEMLIPYKEHGCGDEDPPGFMEKYCTEFKEDEDGSQEKDGKKGWFRNPNQKWDWWQVGGRFNGAIGGESVVRLRDWNCSGERGNTRIDQIWSMYQRAQEAKTAGNKPDMTDSFHLRDILFDLGLVRNTGKNGIDGRPEFEELPLTLEDLRTVHAWYFLPTTYAVLDANGWHSHANSVDGRKKWATEWHSLVTKDRDPDSVLVLVDCHI